MGFYDLLNANVDWDKLNEGIYGEKAEKTKYSLLPHQQRVIQKVHEYFQIKNRGKLIMACGTGKTYTSLKIAEKETKNTKTPTILFLAPSIALVGQTLKEWCAQAEKPIHGICVCSDPKVSQKINEDDDTISDSIIDLALPASTDIETIINQLHYAKELQKEDGGLVVIFSTYQSLDVVSKVQKKANGEVPKYIDITGRKIEHLIFDLCICDEAHRTTGVVLKDKEESSFVKVHDPLFINAKKRLYMTATPRLYSPDTKRKAEEKEVFLCSMDDESLYGEEIDRIGFGEAVSKNLLSDYKVLVLTLQEEEMSAELQNAITLRDSEIPTDDSIKLIGCINALSKITKDSKLITESDPGLMHNAIAFCQSIKNSKKIVKAMDACRDAYYSTLTEDERESLVSINSDHVDGTMGATERTKKLTWLKNVDKESNQCNVLMNVKCLSEGVDVPSLDAVLFLSARNSQVDVVQSVGRVMRKAPGKKYGYIIIPVVIPAGIEPDEALDDNKRFSVVWSVLQALRAHDDRFNATINKIELNKKRPNNILVGGGSLTPTPPDDNDGNNDLGKQLTIDIGKMQGTIYARMVQKCGSRIYWEQWASDVARIAERHISQINQLINIEGSAAQKTFNRYIEGLRKNINPSVSIEDAVEMLAQHFITQPVFEALFENYSFTKNNAVSKSMEAMIKVLNEQTPKEDNEKLNRFYSSVKERVSGIDNAEGKQNIIVELYEKFFKTAFPKTVQKLGIVYTPVEVVDFIINSVEDVLKKEFASSMSNEGVHILDPFTGTGTFIVRLLQSGIIKPEDMARKYKNELHACEIVLLAYYIASINIENAYHDIEENLNGKELNNSPLSKVASPVPIYQDVKQEYSEFDGIVLTDTFQMTEDNSTLLDDVFPQNSARANKLKKTPITVFIGNPPYSVGQKSANDNAQNESYPKLDRRIEETYAKFSGVTNKKSLYDSYIKAFRWCSDRLNILNKKGNKIETRDGIIGFVTNASWLDGNAMDGMRKSFEEEFSSIYIFNLRGNHRTSGELSRKEGGQIFGSGSRAPIAITILVKKKGFNGKAKIYYKAVDDYLTREDKLKLCKEYESILNPEIKAERIVPNEHYDWISKRNDKFTEYITLAPTKKFENDSKSFFSTNAIGLGTNRDAWMYNFSKEKELKNIVNLTNNYNSEVQKSLKYGEKNDDYVPSDDPKYISWSRSLKQSLKSGRYASKDDITIRESLYRPFCKMNIGYSSIFIHCEGQIPKLFPPNMYNLAIGVTGKGSQKTFSPIISNMIPDLEVDSKTQFFPLYWYSKESDNSPSLFGEEAEYKRHAGITDFILHRAKEKYGPKTTKEDIFYYVYGIFHQKDYAFKFESNLKKMLPRLPLISKPQDFWTFSKKGRELADLHLNYEAIPSYEGVIVEGDKGNNYRVNKMRYPQEGQLDTIIYNDEITIKNIPEKAYEYVVNGKSAIAWIMERYQVKTDPKSQITNNPNDWALEHNKPRYILDLLLSIINVSCKTVDIINSLPTVDWDNE